MQPIECPYCDGTCRRFHATPTAHGASPHGHEVACRDCGGTGVRACSSFACSRPAVVVLGGDPCCLICAFDDDLVKILHASVRRAAQMAVAS